MSGYDLLRVDELRSLARDAGIPGYSKARKQELIYALSNNLAKVQTGPMYEIARSRDRAPRTASPRDNDLGSMTRDQLRLLAKDLGLSGYSKDTKSVLIDKINVARKRDNIEGREERGTGADLNSMSISELRSMAREMGITFLGDTKREMVTKIKRKKAVNEFHTSRERR
jgi:hypothetical protein